MVRLFVGQIPKTMEEDGIRPIMEEFGVVTDIKVIRDKISNVHKGCCFVTFDTQQQGETAIGALHNVRILGNLTTPMQVKYAEGESPTQYKLFVGMLTKSTTEDDLTRIFNSFGEIEEVAILRGQNNMGKGCGFVRFRSRDSALKAITALNGAYKLEGAPGHIIVKFADSDKAKQFKKAQQVQAMPQMKHIDPTTTAALYNINPLLANIAASPLAATLLPTIAAALGIPGSSSSTTSSPGNTASAYAYPYAANTNPYSGVPGFASYPTPEPSPQREGPPGCNLFIYHLPQDYSDGTLSQLFAPYGNVLSAKVFVDKVTMQSKCFGFVSYDKAESASAAIAGLNGQQIGYKRLKVSLKKADARPGAPY